MRPHDAYLRPPPPGRPRDGRNASHIPNTLPHQPPFAGSRHKPSTGSGTPPRRTLPDRRVAFSSMPGFRSLPAVGELASELDAPHTLAVAAARATIDERRAELQAGAEDDPDLVARARERLARAQQPSLRRVINATGVIVHT